MYKLKKDHLDCCTSCTEIAALLPLCHSKPEIATSLIRLRKQHLKESNKRYDTFHAEHTSVVVALDLDPAVLAECNYVSLTFSCQF